MEDSITELIFTREGVFVKSPVIVPIKGKSFHEEKITYDELPLSGFCITVKSVEKQEQDGRLEALVFKVSDFQMTGSGESQMPGSITVAATLSWIKYFFINVGHHRAFFPGYNVPFVLETDQEEIMTHVSSAEKGTANGDPAAGILVCGLKKWYKAHSEITIGSKFLIEAIEPHKRYRLSVIGKRE